MNAPNETERRLRVLVADDHAMYRIAVQQLVNTAPDLEVAGVARDGHEAWNMTLELNPDVVVLDGDMPFVSGVEVLSRLRTEMPQVRIVMNTSDPAHSEIARRLGADSVAKEARPEILLAAIRGFPVMAAGS
jgi:DNA-binding NarL/FixJ family response regulator